MKRQTGCQTQLIYSRKELSIFDESDIESTNEEVNKVLQEVRQNCSNVHEKCIFQPVKTQWKEPEVLTQIENVVGLQPGDTSTPFSCASCSNQTRVQHVSMFKRGQHICMPGKYAKKHIKLIQKQVHIYKHHAIVKSVECRTGSRVQMTLIHFYTRKDGLHIDETTEVYDLEYDETYIVDYTATSTNSADTIVKRAENILSENKKFQTYNVFNCNCEHFATWCVLGKEKCFQIEGLQKVTKAISPVFGSGSPITKVLTKALNTSADEIASLFTKEFNIPQVVLGTTFVLYLIYCIFMTVQYRKEHADGMLCASCKRRKLLDLWVELSMFCVTSVVSNIVQNVLVPLMSSTVGVPLMILVLLLSVALQLSVPKILAALRRPVACEQKIVERISEVEVGDIISYPYCTFYHDMVVTEVHENAKYKSKGTLRCVHYGWPSLIGRRVVMEENFDIDLRTEMYLLDMKHLKTYSPEKVVARARKRLGEQKWWPLSSRSDHMCSWAKLDLHTKDETMEHRTISKSKCTEKSSLIVESRDIHLMHEIERGDVVRYNGKTGIIVYMQSVDNDVGRKFGMTLVFCDTFWNVCRKTYKHSIVQTVYHEAHCHPKAIRASNADSEFQKHIKCKNWTTAGFIGGCIMLHP